MVIKDQIVKMREIKDVPLRARSLVEYVSVRCRIFEIIFLFLLLSA